MSRRIYLLGVGLALVALALAFTDWALSFQPGVTEAGGPSAFRLGEMWPGVWIAPAGVERTLPIERREAGHLAASTVSWLP